MDRPTRDADAPVLQPRSMTLPPGSGIHRGAVAAATVVIALALVGGWYLWQRAQAPESAEPAPAAAAPQAPAPPAPAASSAVAAAPLHPIEAAPVQAAASAAPLTLSNADAALRQALVDLLSSRAVAQWLRTDDFIRRTVATVDGLGSAHAAPRLWPVNTSSGRFTVQPDGDAARIDPLNAQRYAAFVGFIESIDVQRAAALYKAHYGLFQQAYRELGYPQGHFNDRLVAVIDQLLATPTPREPPAVRLVEVKGELASTQPWLRCEFVDPQLQALPAGSKLLLRMGPEHATRVKAKLRALRAQVARG